MHVEMRHHLGFALGRCLLPPNEAMPAESDAMAAMAAQLPFTRA